MSETQVTLQHARTQMVILVIEDDLPVQGLLSDILAEDGYQVVTAATVGEALLFLGTVWPQLVTLDSRLPDLDGAYLLEKIRADTQTRSLPVVVISAARVIPLRVRELAQAILPKPFDSEHFRTVVHALSHSSTPL